MVTIVQIIRLTATLIGAAQAVLQEIAGHRKNIRHAKQEHVANEMIANILILIRYAMTRINQAKSHSLSLRRGAPLVTLFQVSNHYQAEVVLTAALDQLF